MTHQSTTSEDEKDNDIKAEASSASQKVSRRQQVLEAIIGLHDMGIKPIKTANLCSHTGLTRQQVADAIKDLEARGEIVKPMEGQYEPVFRYPPAQTLTISSMPDGTRVLEKGDVVMILTPFEYMYELAPMVAGSATQALFVQYAEQMLHIAATNIRLEREIRALKAHTKFRDDRQMNMEV